MSAQSHELPPTLEDIEAAQQELRDANLRWGESIGVHEATIHDLDSLRAEHELERAEKAGRDLSRLLAKYRHDTSEMSPSKAMSAAFRRFFSH